MIWCYNCNKVAVPKIVELENRTQTRCGNCDILFNSENNSMGRKIHELMEENKEKAKIS